MLITCNLPCLTGTRLLQDVTLTDSRIAILQSLISAITGQSVFPKITGMDFFQQSVLDGSSPMKNSGPVYFLYSLALRSGEVMDWQVMMPSALDVSFISPT